MTRGHVAKGSCDHKVMCLVLQTSPKVLDSPTSLLWWLSLSITLKRWLLYRVYIYAIYLYLCPNCTLLTSDLLSNAQCGNTVGYFQMLGLSEKHYLDEDVFPLLWWLHLQNIALNKYVFWVCLTVMCILPWIVVLCHTEENMFYLPTWNCKMAPIYFVYNAVGINIEMKDMRILSLNTVSLNENYIHM